MQRFTSRAVLLDTCAVIFFAEGFPMAEGAIGRLAEARTKDGILISPISAWEVGLLHKKRQGDGLRFDPDPAAWLRRVRSAEGISIAPLTLEIGLGASLLPGIFHNDPADRLLVATARELGLPIVTRDRLILGYAAAGHVAAIRC